MKFKSLLFVAAASLLAFAGCQTKENTTPSGETTFELNKETLEFTKDAGENTVALTSNIAWTVKDSDKLPSWISVTPASGDGNATITVAVTENKAANREAAIVVYGNKAYSATLTVKQAGPQGDADALTVAEFLAKKDTQTAYKLTGKVTGYGATYNDFTLQDETGSIYVYSLDDASKTAYAGKIANGGNITIKGVYKWYEHKTDPSKSKAEIEKATVISYSDPAPIDPVTCAKISEVKALASDTPVTLNGATVHAVYTKGYLVSDGEDYLLVHVDADPKVEKGDVVNVSGTFTYYPTNAPVKYPQISGTVVTTGVSKGAEVVYPSATDITANFANYDISSTGKYVKYVKVSATIKKDGNYFNFYVGNITARTGGLLTAASEDLSKYDQRDCTIEGFFVYASGASNQYFYILATKITPAAGYLTVSPAAISVSAETTSAKFNIESDLDWQIAEVDGITITPMSGNGNQEVSLAFAKNTKTTSVKSTITVSAGDKTATVELTQAGAVDPSAVVQELTNGEIVASFAASTATSNIYGDWSISSKSGTWTGNMNTKKDFEYVQIRNSYGAHLKTPEFATAIQKIEIVACATISGSNEQERSVYAMPNDTNLATASTSEKYTTTVDFSKAYADPVVFKGGVNVEITKTIEFKATDIKQCLIVSKDGALYIKSVKVYLKGN